jgi:hypothetical protein
MPVPDRKSDDALYERSLLDIMWAGDKPPCPECQGELSRPWRINIGNGLEILCNVCGAAKLDAAGSQVTALIDHVMVAAGLVQFDDGVWRPPGPPPFTRQILPDDFDETDPARERRDGASLRSSPSASKTARGGAVDPPQLSRVRKRGRA